MVYSLDEEAQQNLIVLPQAAHLLHIYINNWQQRQPAEQRQALFVRNFILFTFCIVQLNVFQLIEALGYWSIDF